MDERERNTIIRICATVAYHYFNRELPTCSRRDCPNREPVEPTAYESIMPRIREMLAELSASRLHEQRAPYADTPVDELDNLLNDVRRLLEQRDDWT